MYADICLYVYINIGVRLVLVSILLIIVCCYCVAWHVFLLHIHALSFGLLLLQIHTLTQRLCIDPVIADRFEVLSMDSN